MLDASLAVRRGSFHLELAMQCRGVTAVMGPNGSGKTTLLRALLGAERPERGQITLSGRILFDAGRGVDVPVEERAIAYVPQGYGLFPHLSVLDNVLFGVPRARAKRRERALELLSRLELADAASRRPSALSGGEQQRAALARALAAEPRLLLLDEPLAALDVAARPRVRRFLADWLHRAQLPAIVATHDPADARVFADRLVVLEAGRIAQKGRPDDVAAHPANAFVAALSPGLLAQGGEVDHAEALDEDE